MNVARPLPFVYLVSPAPDIIITITVCFLVVWIIHSLIFSFLSFFPHPRETACTSSQPQHGFTLPGRWVPGNQHRAHAMIYILHLGHATESPLRRPPPVGSSGTKAPVHFLGMDWAWSPWGHSSSLRGTRALARGPGPAMAQPSCPRLPLASRMAFVKHLLHTH